MNIKELRASLKLSQAAFAKAVGVGVSTVGAYENGRIKPSETVLAKIKELYGADAVKSAPVEEAKPATKKAPAKKKPAAKKKAEEAPTPVEEAPVVEAPVVADTPTEPAPAVEAKPSAKKSTAKKPAAKKVKAEKPASKKSAAAKKPAAEKTTTPAVIIQSPLGGEITPEDILGRIGIVDKVYIRVDENKAYWVKGDETGSIDLW